MDRAPDPLTFTSGATWAERSVVYLGSRVTPSQPRPGQTVTLAHYFTAARTPPDGYKLFVHLVDARSGQMVINLDHEIQGGALPLGRWPVGKVIEDVHTLTVPQLPPELSGLQLRLVLGFWRDDERLAPDDAAAQDGTGRVWGPPLPLQAEAGAEPLPEYQVRRAVQPPKIDGDLSDSVWGQAEAVELRGSFDGRRSTLRTTARLLYDRDHLYLSFDCEDPDVWGTLKKRDEPIYNEEVVELFVDADGDGKTYNEIEVSPHNVLFDAYFPARRQGMDTSWDSGVRSAVKVAGTLDDRSDRDRGWTVEMAVRLDRLAQVPRLPPQPGDRWRFNLYRLEHPGRRSVEGQAFSPLGMGDFHHLPRFGWLVFR